MTIAKSLPAPKAGAVKDLINSLFDAIGDNDGNSAVTHFIDTGYAPLNERISGRYDGGLPFGRKIEIGGMSR